MTYDDWKTESPEDERERLDRVSRRRQDRAEWEEEHADQLLEDLQERRLREPEDDL